MGARARHPTTHSGTHVDAPYHYHPTSAGRPARTIDQVPFRWLMGDGVVLDLRQCDRTVQGIREHDVRAALDRIGYQLEPYDIVLVRTDVSRHYDEPGYELRHPGLRRDATAWLVAQGVRLIGIDAWGIDRAFDVMSAEARAGDDAQLWEAPHRTPAGTGARRSSGQEGGHEDERGVPADADVVRRLRRGLVQV